MVANHFFILHYSNSLVARSPSGCATGQAQAKSQTKKSLCLRVSVFISLDGIEGVVSFFPTGRMSAYYI